MRICVDLTSLDDNFSGVERFALSITKALIKGNDHNWILLFKNSVYRDFEDTTDNVNKIVIHGKNKLIFNQVILPIVLAKIKADCFFFPAFPAPFFFFKRTAFNTIHDLSCWDCPKSNKGHMILYFKIMFWKASLCNKQIITVSEFSKSRICSILHVKPENITVIYNGLSDIFNRKPVSSLEAKKVREKYNLPNDYVLSLSTLEPRKNLRLMLDAYSELFNEGVVEEIVLAGRKGWKMDNFLNGYKDTFLTHVHFTGFIDDDDLPIVYKLAKLFVFPSIYEGFGIPPLEALACGTNVISSSATSMPEVLGKYATYFNPNSVAELKAAIKAQCISTQKASLLLEQSEKKYSWEKQANKLLQKLQEART